VTFLIWYYFARPGSRRSGTRRSQPVPYSHRLHAGQLGLDCRYCHVNVERAPLAMVPPTETCMNCHQLVKTDSKRCSSRSATAGRGKPMEWVRIHKLPDYVYFDHSVHVTAGVGCAECHGRIDQMEQVRMEKPLSMGWCLDCHRDVKDKQGDSAFIRPVAQMTNMASCTRGTSTAPRSLNPVRRTAWGATDDQVSALPRPPRTAGQAPR
jgi:hypothetical protein